MPRYDTCLNCGKVVVSPHLNRSKDFCNRQCRTEFITRARQRTCKHCGKTFLAQTVNSTPIYCSSQCYFDEIKVTPKNSPAYKQRTNYTKVCEHCGEEFTDKNHPKRRYCSKECSYSAKKKNIEKTCLHCGKVYFVKPKRATKSKFCSQTCSNRYNQPKDPSKKATFTCKWCGKEFESWAYRNPTICSAQCRSEYGARQPKPNLRKPESFVTQDCAVCGKPYTVHRCQIELRNSKYCSTECAYIAVSERMKAEGNPNYIDGSSPQNYGENWDRQRRKARNRDNDTCQKCHAVHDFQNGIIIDVHHKVPFRLFNGDYKTANKLDNLVCLCRTCHREAENAFRVILGASQASQDRRSR